MPRYAIITPKEGAVPPANTGKGWAFQHNSEWHEIGTGRAFEEVVAEHARMFFTVKPVDGGETVCSVEIEYREGALTLTPATVPVEHTCPVEGCSQTFTDVTVFGAHVKECALSAVKKPFKKEDPQKGEPQKGGADQKEGE